MSRIHEAPKRAQMERAGAQDAELAARNGILQAGAGAEAVRTGDRRGGVAQSGAGTFAVERPAAV